MQTSPTTPETPESPSIPAPETTISAPGIRVKPTRKSTTTRSTTTNPEENAAAFSDDPIGPADPIDTDTGTRSTDDEGQKTAAVKVGKTAFADIAQAIIAVLSLFLNSRLADDEVDPDAWIATQKEQSQIGDPIAAIAARRTGMGELAPDAADLIKAGIGAAGYLGRNVKDAFVAGRNRRRAKRLHLATPEAPETAQEPQWGQQ